MEPLLYALFVLTASGCALYIGRCWLKASSSGGRALLFCCALALLLLSGLAGTGFVETALDWPAPQARLWLDQATRLLGLPLLALGVHNLFRGILWAKDTWGRWVLALCLAFELTRMMGVNLWYAQFLAIGSAAAIFSATWPWRTETKDWISLGGAVLFFILPWIEPKAQVWVLLPIGPLAVWLIHHRLQMIKTI